MNASIFACRHMAFMLWEFEKNGRELKVRVDGQLVFNTSALILNAAVGRAMAWHIQTEQQVQRRLDSGELCPRARRLVSALYWLSPLLCEPPATVGGVRSSGWTRCAIRRVRDGSRSNRNETNLLDNKTEVRWAGESAFGDVNERTTRPSIGYCGSL